MVANLNELSPFVWSEADVLCDNSKQYDSGKVVLPFALVRRMLAVGQ